MLTRAEVEAIIQKAKYFRGGTSWGYSTTELWPAGVVAQLRGVEFEQKGQIVYLRDGQIALQTFVDIVEFLVLKDIDAYFTTLDEQGEKILDLFKARLEETL